ncbi:MAG: ascorbate-dependent monooxygenase [Verrucomicrobiota bacterium]
MKFLSLLLALVVTSRCRAQSPKGEPTYCRDIAPLVQANCVTCHRPGEVAPFSLLTYNDVRKHGKTIAAVIKARIMPPWKAVPGYGEFVGARRLTDEQVSLIQEWFKAGMPEGDQKDLPASPTFVSGWQLGNPDIVLTMPEPYGMPAEGNDIHRNFVLPLQLPEGKYIRAIEYRPSNRRVVHHAVLAMDTTHSSRERDEADPGPGFTQVLLPGRMLPGNMSIWTPGWNPVPLPEGLSLPWPKGADLVLQLHFHLSGKPESEQSRIGIFLTDHPPSKSSVDVLLEDRRIDIPPGEKAYRSRDSEVLPVAVDVFGLFPHMHWLGKEVKVIARMPGGKKRTLLWINDWDFKWQMYYQYSKPVRLPAGTELIMECVHDNSIDNLNNPSLTPQRVRWGIQTFDEMSDVVVQMIPVNQTDVPRLQAYRQSQKDSEAP